MLGKRQWNWMSNKNLKTMAGQMCEEANMQQPVVILSNVIEV